MKALLEIRTAVHSFRGFRRLLRSAVVGGAVAALLASAHVFGQGAYYPVFPPGTLNYTGITVHSNPNLQMMQNILQAMDGPTVTLQNPIPAGDSAPTTAQYSAMVATCITDILNGQENGTGITIATLSNEAVAWNLANRATTATAIAQAIIQVDFTTNNNPAQALTDLSTVTNALAVSQPTNIDSIVPSILTQVQATAALAVGIPQVVTAAISAIPTDLTRIASIVNSGASSIQNASLTSSQKTMLFVAPNPTGYIFNLMNSSAATDNPTVISAITQAVTYNSYLSLASLTQIVGDAAFALPMKNNFTVAAVVDGALISQGASSATIQSAAASGAPSFSTYIGFVVGGYNNSSTTAALQAYLTSNQGAADAIASGAVTKGIISASTVLQYALTYGETGVGGDPNPASVVAEAILGNVNAATTTILGAINTSSHTPYGTNVTFAEVALGAAEGAQIQNIGNMVQTILLNSAASITALSSPTVNSVVSNAIDGATNSNNAGAYGDIVYKAESVARNTSGISASLVQAAITEIQTDGGLPYIAPIAAAAGDIYGANRAAIQGSVTGFLTGTNLAAANQGLALVQNIQTNSTTHFTSILSAMNTAQSTSADAVRADVYAAIMSDSNEYDADLAAALKQSTVSDTTLTTDAENAIRGINASLVPNLQMVDIVVEHIKTESTAGSGATSVTDLLDFVSHQITIDSALTNDIAIAATVVDPDHAHYVATAVAFQAPMSVYSVVAPIFEYAQITNPHPLALPTNGNPSGALTNIPNKFPGTLGQITDQPAAAAAITAALTTGIIEANLSTANTQTALSTAVAAAVAASITQNGTNLQGPTNPFNNSGDTAKQFQVSTGASISASSGTRTVGAAGAITGFVAEMTTSGQSTISAVTEAVLTAATGGAARPYALQMAQAAAQAFAWVSGLSAPVTSIPAGAAPGNPVYDIAEAIAPSVTGFATLTQLENAVAFGINQAEAGVIGAGALGLNAGSGAAGSTPGSGSLNLGNGSLVVGASGNPNSAFYLHRSATGTPVTDIFNL